MEFQFATFSKQNEKVPKKLETFLNVLQADGYTILGEDEWKDLGDLHPFLMPVATSGDGDTIDVVGLSLRTPNGQKLRPDDYQVVTQKSRKTWKLSLMAVSMEKWISKRAEEANFNRQEKDEGVVEAVKDTYDFKFTGASRNALDKFLLLQVGAFPDIYRQLAQERIDAGDAKSGLVIADSMRDAFGTQWAFPHSYICKILRTHFDGKEASGDVDRGMEADHSAERCFKTGYPLWSLAEEDDLEDLLKEANMPRLNNVADLRVFYLKRVTDDQRAAVKVGDLSDGCATVAKAQALMDAVCCGHKSYSGIRQELHDMYDEVPGCEPLVDMIRYFMR